MPNRTPPPRTLVATRTGAASGQAVLFRFAVLPDGPRLFAAYDKHSCHCLQVMQFYQQSDTVILEPAWFAPEVPTIIEGDANRVRGICGQQYMGQPRPSLSLSRFPDIHGQCQVVCAHDS